MQAIDKIILGTVQFGLEYGINNRAGKPDTHVIKAILDAAYQHGIRILDTAEAYGNSQDLIGDYHKTSPHKFEIISKFSPKGENDLEEHVLHNIKTLNVGALYGYMYHSYGDFEKYNEKHQKDIQSLKQTKLIKNFGVSVYTNEELEKLLKYEGIDFIQMPFNLLDNFYQRAEIMAKAKKRGIKIHTRSAFLQGLLFKNPQELPGKLAQLQTHLQEINRISEKKAITIEALALNYSIQQQLIDYVLIGVDTAAQLAANVKSLQRQLSDDVIEEINTIQVKQTELLNPSNWK